MSDQNSDKLPKSIEKPLIFIKTPPKSPKTEEHKKLIREIVLDLIKQRKLRRQNQTAKNLPEPDKKQENPIEEFLKNELDSQNEKCGSDEKSRNDSKNLENQTKSLEISEKSLNNSLRKNETEIQKIQQNNSMQVSKYGAFYKEGQKNEPHFLSREEIEIYKKEMKERPELIKKMYESMEKERSPKRNLNRNSLPRQGGEFWHYESLQQKIEKSGKYKIKNFVSGSEQNSFLHSENSKNIEQNNSKIEKRTASPVYTENKKWDDLVKQISTQLAQTKLLHLRSKLKKSPEKCHGDTIPIASFMGKNVQERNREWLENKNEKISYKKAVKNADELLGCTFSPKVHQTKYKAIPHLHSHRFIEKTNQKKKM